MPTQSIAGLALRVPIGRVDGDVETNLLDLRGEVMTTSRLRFTAIQSLVPKKPLRSPTFPSTCSTLFRRGQTVDHVEHLDHVDHWVGLHVHSWLLSISEFTVVELQKLQTPCRS